MDKLVLFTLKQRVVLNLLFILLIIIGTFTLLRIPVDRYPNIHFGKMYINTYLPGASPEEVETLVTREIEDSLEELEEIDYIRSSSYQGRSNIVIKFPDNSDYRKIYDDVRIKVLSIAGNLPELADPPVFNFLDVGDWFPVVSVNVSGSHTNTTLKLVAEELKIPLAGIPEVSRVKIQGEYTREFHIQLAPGKLQQYGLTFSEVTESLGRANISLPAGHVLSSHGEFSLRVDEQFTTRQQVLATILRTDADGSFIRLADVIDEAQVTYREPYILASINGEDCVTLQVLKKEQGNALRIAAKVHEIVKNLAPFYADEQIRLTVTQDSSIRIKDSIRVLGVNLLVGIILVCGIIWLFMGLRNAALTTIGIPFAFLVTLIFMYVTGNSVNEVSLFAFILVSGIIVDDAIVVVENIYRHAKAGKPVQQAIAVGTSEVFLPVVSATLTTIAAFMPMLLMTGMVGDFFAIIPKTIVFALLASLLECLVILPCHYLEFGHSEQPAPMSPNLPVTQVEQENAVMKITRNISNQLILLTLRYRFTSQVLLILAFVTAISIFALSFMGKSNLIRIQFFPDNYSLYYVEIFAPSGTSITQTNTVVKNIAALLHEDGPEMAESALGFAGYYIDDDFTPQYGRTLGHVAVTLPPVDTRRFVDYPQNDVIKHLEYIRARLAKHIPEQFTLVVRPEKDGPPIGKDITIRVLGNNAQNVELLAGEMKHFLNTQQSVSPWIVDLRDDQGQANTIFRIQVDREKTAELGLSPQKIVEIAAATGDGQTVGLMKLADEQIDIIVKLKRPEQIDPVHLLETPIVDLPTGMIRLRDVCKVAYSVEPGILNRFQQQRSITLTANIRTASPVSPPMIVDKAMAHYDNIRQKYPGATLSFAGEHESTQKSFLSLSYAFAIAMILIYLILAAQFKSYLQPMIIIAAVVFALLGVTFGTLLSRTLFTINSFVAVIGVTGVVVNDSLVLVAFINNCYQGGMQRREALIKATNTRLRPILLTTLTTTLGLLPMALGIPEYSIVWGSMAMTFVTGLCTATILTIILVPAQWDIITHLTETAKKQD
ncbi:efflux RND transporter permease subunit [Desulfogranum japonicum]|uniref:efflux RND transporter permease subunit n=1 Tax=Desulfogranum japonicum TaxID=231447 RepID=UPI0004040837|nr:efflux RND transporter permease subunit [Desulfogranum japonicum]